MLSKIISALPFDWIANTFFFFFFLKEINIEHTYFWGVGGKKLEDIQKFKTHTKIWLDCEVFMIDI